MFSIQSPGHGWHCTARDSCLAAHTARPNQRLTHPACSQKRMGPLIAYTAGQTQQQPAADQQWQPARRQILSAGCSCCFGLLSLNQNSTASANEGYKFSYGEEVGSLSWGGACSTGTHQSPVNLPRTAAAATSCSSTPQPIIEYKIDNYVRIKNTGTTIQVNLPTGNTVSWGQQQLELLQYHFHTPSEHAWDGQRAVMEAHLVHRNKTTGGFFVLGVMLQPLKNALQQQPNPCLATALQYVPQELATDAACPTPVNPAQLLPVGAAAGQFVHYQGSLTTPPCSETVDWLVYEQPLPITDQQVLEFMWFTGAGKTYGHNARPLQPLNERSLDHHCLSAA